MSDFFYPSIQAMFGIGMSRDIPEMAVPPLGLPSINLGAGKKKVVPGDPIPLDYPDWDATDPMPFVDGSVGTIHAYHFLEHLNGEDVICVMAEAQRVLAPGGVMNIIVPYYNSQLMALSVDHKTAFCEDTLKNLFTDDYWDYPGTPAGGWRLQIGLNIIIGIVERNLCLMTQLVRESDPAPAPKSRAADDDILS